MATKKHNLGTDWYSSYQKNNYGELFYALIRVYQPQKVVELGTKAGYSAYHIAKALKENKKGKLDCYDLWENYQYNSVPLSETKKNLNKFLKYINFYLGDAIGIENNYQPGEVDILHVDLSNDGILLEQIIPNWIEKINQLIIIEGGSKERDKIDWMIKYKKMPIQKWLKDFAKRFDIEYMVLEPFPSITLIRKG